MVKHLYDRRGIVTADALQNLPHSLTELMTLYDVNGYA
jgi:hypothetical protein